MPPAVSARFGGSNRAFGPFPALGRVFCVDSGVVRAGAFAPPKRVNSFRDFGKRLVRRLWFGAVFAWLPVSALPEAARFSLDRGGERSGREPTERPCARSRRDIATAPCPCPAARDCYIRLDPRVRTGHHLELGIAPVLPFGLVHLALLGPRVAHEHPVERGLVLETVTAPVEACRFELRMLLLLFLDQRNREVLVDPLPSDHRD